MKSASPMGLLLTLGLLVTTSGCIPDDPTDQKTDPVPGEIEVVNDAATGTVGSPLSSNTQVILRDTAGSALASWVLAWTVASGGGSVEAAETMTDGSGVSQNLWTLGQVAGTQELTVKVKGGTVGATVTATAAPGPPSTVTVSPDSILIEGLGQTEQLSAAVQDQFGNEVTTASVGWSSSNNSVATVSTSGLVQSQSEGQVTITASAGSASGTAKVVVEPAISVTVSPSTATLDALGDQVSLSATVRDENGDIISGASVTWSSNATGVASVSSSGVVTAQGVGTAEIEADYQGTASGTAEIVVRQVAASLEISPAARTLRVDSTAEFTATLRDANDNAIADASYAWASTNTSIFEVTATDGASATITARAEGTAQLEVDAGGLSAAADITVASTALADSVQVTPALDTVTVGDTGQLSIEAWSAGMPITDPVATWSSSATAVATVDDTGLVTGQAEGVATITGSVDGVTDDATVAVVGSTGLLSTAFFKGDFEASATAGTVVAVPVRLDMSRASPNGDLGSVQFELGYDVATMAYDSASVLGGGLVNEQSAGTISYAFASTSSQGTGNIVLATFYFTIDAALAAGEVITIDLTYTEPPSDTDVNDYSMPVVVTGTLRVTP